MAILTDEYDGGVIVLSSEHVMFLQLSLRTSGLKATRAKPESPRVAVLSVAHERRNPIASIAQRDENRNTNHFEPSFILNSQASALANPNMIFPP